MFCSFPGNLDAVITCDLSHFHSLCSPLPQATILHSVAGKCSVIRVRYLGAEHGLVRNASRSGVCESAALLVPSLSVFLCLSCCVKIRVLVNVCVCWGVCRSSGWVQLCTLSVYVLALRVVVSY